MTADKTSAQAYRTPREQLLDLLDEFAHILPAQAPIKDFVHHNTLHGFQHLKFQDALKATHELTGAYGYQSQAQFRDHYKQGRITDADLDAILDKDESLQASEVVFQTDSGRTFRRHIYRVGLLFPLKGISPCQLNWQVDEAHALNQIQSDVTESARARILERASQQELTSESEAIEDLWAACLEILNLDLQMLHPEALVDLAPDDAQRLFDNLFSEEHEGTKTARIDGLIKQETRALREDLFLQLGDKFTFRGLLQKLTGTDIQDEILPYFQHYIANWLDQGIAAWQASDKQGGFYQAWKNSAKTDLSWVLNQLPDWEEHINSLPDDPLDTIITELMRMDIPRSSWAGYIKRLALDLPGWSGMFYWRHKHPDYEGLEANTQMMDYLAVRLVLEHLFANRLCREQWLVATNLSDIRGYFRRNNSEFLVRDALYNQQLPEYLITLAQQLIERSTVENYPAETWHQLAHMIWTWQQSPAGKKQAGYSVYEHGWKLFRLAQHLGLCGADIRAMQPEQINDLFACIDRLNPETAGFLLLQAYEHHYREQIFTAVSKNHARGLWANRTNRPAAQIIFCMDDREEGIRRHLETLNPAIETLGAAAFFDIVMNWQGLGAENAVALCPVVRIPIHQIEEITSPGAENAVEKHLRRQQLRNRLKTLLMQKTRRSVLTSAGLIATAAPATLIALASKIFLPLQWNNLTRRFNSDVSTRVKLSIDKEDEQRSIHHNQPGFTITEQVEIVAGFLRTNGLTAGFGHFVVMMGHYSRNENNPHTAAYGCGACSGKYSGPNARVFAAMANHPEVRQRLAEKDINIPDDCWFVGAEHDTCNEDIIWQDHDLIPDSLREDFNRLVSDLKLAAKHSAHERCRKLASAPLRPSLDQAARHIAGRGVDFSQARPELGHATNAVGFVGRRSFTHSAFFDRRCFLISYDASTDPDGSLLENLLLSVGPVGVGINLEYYFSTVNNDYYGSGSKIMHNLSGLLGVMEGGSSDLRTGLPQQMIEIHEPMRLQLMIEASLEILTAIYERQPPIRELVENGWLLLSAKDPDSEAIHYFEPEQGWQNWQPQTEQLEQIPTVEHSADWYTGQRDHLPPALIKRVNRG